MDAILKAHSTLDLSDKQLILCLPAKNRAKDHRLVGKVFKKLAEYGISRERGNYVPNRFWLLISEATFSQTKEWLVWSDIFQLGGEHPE